MAFDSDAWMSAHRPWSVTVGERTFTARHVSAPQALDFQRRMTDAHALPKAKGHSDAQHAMRITQATHAAHHWILRVAFPWRVSFLWHDPVALILGLPPGARQEALADFFACLWVGLPTLPQNRTNGTSSPRKTPIPTR